MDGKTLPGKYVVEMVETALHLATPLAPHPPGLWQEIQGRVKCGKVRGTALSANGTCCIDSLHSSIHTAQHSIGQLCDLLSTHNT